jgi:hypothetical protein
MIGKILRKVHPFAVFGIVMWLGFGVLEDVHNSDKRVVGGLLFLVAAFALVTFVEFVWGDDDSTVRKIARRRDYFGESDAEQIMREMRERRKRDDTAKNERDAAS